VCVSVVCDRFQAYINFIMTTKGLIIPTFPVNTLMNLIFSMQHLDTAN